MQEVLFEYQMHPTTWIYLSSLLTIGIYFKFHRLLSVRNLDLLALIFSAPGLLLVARGMETAGYVWLFTVGALLLVRLLLDPVMVRRPLLEPNLNASGLTFTGVAMIVFMMANVGAAQMTETDHEGAKRWDQILTRQAAAGEQDDLRRYGPGYPLFYAFADLPSRLLMPTDDTQSEPFQHDLFLTVSTRATAILGHLAVVIGMVLIGYRHFDNIQTGVAAATLYLILPYTTQMAGRVDHVIPGALLVWAVEAYRRPMVAGMLIGLAGGVIYYPLFLLPLWCSFYWQRGLVRFLIGAAAMLILVVLSLALWPGTSFSEQFKQLLGWSTWSAAGADGFWSHHGLAFYYRIPVIAGFLALCFGLIPWPPQKNLGTLLSCSAAVMLATQFWKAHQGGLYMAWYLPLLILTVFRPNLEDRVALTAVGERWGLAMPPKWFARWRQKSTSRTRATAA